MSSLALVKSAGHDNRADEEADMMLGMNIALLSVCARAHSSLAVLLMPNLTRSILNSSWIDGVGNSKSNLFSIFRPL